jgi:hypothetical protein
MNKAISNNDVGKLVSPGLTHHNSGTMPVKKLFVLIKRNTIIFGEEKALDSNELEEVNKFRNDFEWYLKSSD